MTLGAATAITAIDAVLLQRSKGFFTGGFLAAEHLHGVADTVAFLIVSVLSDAAIAGVLAAVAMTVLAKCRLRTGACIIGGFLAAVVPLAIADVLGYELIRYVGDAMDLSLMFDLTGRSVGELFAVSSSHLVLPALLTIGVVAVAAGLVWLAHRYSRDTRHWRFGRRAFWMPALATLVAAGTVTLSASMNDTFEDGILRKPSGRVITSIVNTLTDFDRDGFGLAGRQRDPDLFNASIFPYAVDLPGDGIDQDGVAGDLPSGTPAYVETPPSAAPWVRRPDVVLVVLESFRADLVGARVDGRQVTPVLDALASRGISSAHAYSHNGYTAQSRFHVFAGSLAGVRDHRTLVDDFKKNGYTVAYFSGQDESFGGPAYSSGFERADVHYDARDDRARRYSGFVTPGSLAVPFTLVNERITSFLQSYGANDKPLFLYVNFEDTHFPYWHPGIEPLISSTRLARAQISPASRAQLRLTYENTAANVDRAIGTVLDAIRMTRGRAPAVIVSGDHGESLYDEGFLGHGYSLNDVQTHIPLVAANLPIVIREPFGQADLRDAVDQAMRVGVDEPATPRVATSDREVFQYLGTLNRPRQIGFVRTGGRTIYDFREERVQFNGGPWRRPSDLHDAEQSEYLRLIREWERMMVARQSGGIGDE